MWLYEQMTGDLYRDGVFVGTGYSGHGKTSKMGRNNPAMESVKGVGPCPAGLYTIGPAHTSAKVGPVAMNLNPQPGTNMFGRSAMMIHGDNKASDASKGCIILARSIRTRIAASKDRTLSVVRNYEAPPITAKANKAKAKAKARA